MRDLVNRARQGSLRSSELGSATATVTNLGDQGVEKVFGVIHPPQVALIGFGRIAPQPWAGADGGVSAVPVVTASLAGDSRRLTNWCSTVRNVWALERCARVARRIAQAQGAAGRST